MERETKKILGIVWGESGYNCGHCRACLRIEEKIDKIIKRIKLEVKESG